MAKKNLRARLDDTIWTVTDLDSRRWWTATNSGERAHILNEKLGVVKPTSQLGTEIRAAVAAAESKNA